MFDNLRVVEPNGGVLSAVAATYDEHQATLVGTGPIRYTTASMQVNATGAVMTLKDGTVDVDGPVVGRLDKRHGPEPRGRP